MKFCIILLPLILVSNTSNALVNAHYYHCKDKKISIAFFHLLEEKNINENALSVEKRGRAIPAKNVTVTSQKDFIEISSVIGSVKHQKISFRLKKPQVVPTNKERMVMRYDRKFKTELKIEGKISRNPRHLTCEVFGLNDDFFGEIPRYLP